MKPVLLNVFVALIVVSSLIFFSSPVFALSLAVVFLPSVALVRITCKELDAASLLIAGFGAGMAFVALTTRLFKIVSLPLDVFSIALTLAAVAITSAVLEKRHKPKTRDKLKLREPERRIRNYAALALLAIFILGMASRLYPVKDMNAPLFADPAVEGTIARLVVDNRGIPDTWAPYLPIGLEHQTGFASVVAWMNITSGLPIPKIILLLTSFMHAVFPLAIYLLAYKIFKRRLQSMAASLVALAAAFPTYIFVAGMNSSVMVYSLVPIAMALAIAALKNPALRPNAMLVVVSLGGALIHPMFIFFYGVLLVPYILAFLATRTNRKYSKNALVLLLSSLLLPAVLSMDIGEALSGHAHPLAKRQWELQSDYINPQKTMNAAWVVEPLFTFFSNTKGAWYSYIEKMDVASLFTEHFVGVFYVLIFSYAAYLIVKKRDAIGFVLLTWYALFLLFSTVQGYYRFEFPGWMFLYPSRVKFLMVVPLSLILSYALIGGSHTNLKTGRMRQMLPLLFIAMLVMLPLNLLYIGNHLEELSAKDMVSDSDWRTMMWMREHVNGNDTILNTLTAIEAGAFIGNSGQWIPAVTSNPVLFPATSLTDDILNPAVQKRLEVMKLMADGNVTSREFFDMLKGYNISYVYLAPEPSNPPSVFGKVGVENFLASPFYKLSYVDGGSYLFSVNYPEKGG